MLSSSSETELQGDPASFRRMDTRRLSNLSIITESPTFEESESSPKVSRNVKIMLLLCVLYGFADSIWTGTIIVAWVQILSGGADASDSNKQVGYVEATQGLAMLFTAIPVGYLADKVSRQLAIRLGAIGFLVATGLTAFAIFNPSNSTFDVQYYFILGSMALWGTGQGVFNGPAMALFADSVPRGQRSKWYMLLQMAYIVPAVAGPLAAIILLSIYGDEWTLSELRPVFLFGVFAEIPPTLISFLMRDANALSNGGEEFSDEDEDADKGGAQVKSFNESDQEEDDPGGEMHTRDKRCITVKSIPYVLFVSSLIIAIGSGMTIKYFPLYFKSDISPKLTPRDVQGIYVCVPVVIALFTVLNQVVASRCGRVQTMVLSQIAGICLLVTMSLLVSNGITRWTIIVPIYVIRTGLMTSTYPLNESILMDFVPKKKRARWKSLESISSLGWCGSAVLGGVLADSTSYSSTFLYTAGLQFIGVLLQGTLVWVVPRKEQKQQKADDDGRDGRFSRVDNLEEPLL